MIADFKHNTDQIQLKKSIFKKLAKGDLSAKNFSKKGRAMDKDDYIIYNSKTGALLYDKDGKGGVAAVQFANLEKKANLKAGDFFVAR